MSIAESNFQRRIPPPVLDVVRPDESIEHQLSVLLWDHPAWFADPEWQVRTYRDALAEVEGISETLKHDILDALVEFLNETHRAVIRWGPVDVDVLGCWRRALKAAGRPAPWRLVRRVRLGDLAPTLAAAAPQELEIPGVRPLYPVGREDPVTGAGVEASWFEALGGGYRLAAERRWDGAGVAKEFERLGREWKATGEPPPWDRLAPELARELIAEWFGWVKVAGGRAEAVRDLGRLARELPSGELRVAAESLLSHERGHV